VRLIGMMDSPYVRRVAISLKHLGIPFDHRPLSVFRDFEAFRQINPLVKAPTLVCDDGEVLVESTLILEYVETLAPNKSLMPTDQRRRQSALRLTGIALMACEKTVQMAYERNLRPPEKRHQPWLERVGLQLTAAYDLLEAASGKAGPWLVDSRLTQADITVAVAWRFTNFIIPDAIDAGRYPALTTFSERAEQLPEFLSMPLE
jgi:glutathione S-transferase